MKHSEDHLHELAALKEQRKQGDLDALEYYKGLLRITTDLIQSLRDENISEIEAKKQIPLLLVFLEEQIAKLADRSCLP